MGKHYGKIEIMSAMLTVTSGKVFQACIGRTANEYKNAEVRQIGITRARLSDQCDDLSSIVNKSVGASRVLAVIIL